MSGTYQLSDLQAALKARTLGLPTTATTMAQHTNNVDVLALTLIGEARGESLDGRVAIAYTVKNRVDEKGWTIADRCFQKLQYSCWWIEGGQANYRYLLDFAEKVMARGAVTWTTPGEIALLAECRYLAAGVINGQLRDRTRGATHYCTTELLKHPPAWAREKDPTAVIGSHSFFAGIAWS